MNKPPAMKSDYRLIRVVQQQQQFERTPCCQALRSDPWIMIRFGCGCECLVRAQTPFVATASTNDGRPRKRRGRATRPLIGRAAERGRRRTTPPPPLLPPLLLQEPG
ncbi:hypothetical protein F2P81_010224 [Scophthalmus maximus]|uniref:Uncharacterized protein n=1 Tax=Scophthalmus maximus TaxID=52904 RepID=A0A6A4SZV5_SCOMX|nr:hypothetical protein F2P81_010224 [Scophthalmus maximus]